MTNAGPDLASRPAVVDARLNARPVTFVSCSADSRQPRLDSLPPIANDLLRIGLPEPPILPSSPQSTFNAVTLAYLGDAVWEVAVRNHAWEKLASQGEGSHTLHTSKLQQFSSLRARATQQAIYHDLLVQAAAGITDTTTAMQEAAIEPKEPTATLIPSDNNSCTDARAAQNLALNVGDYQPAAVPPGLIGMVTEEDVDFLRWARNGSNVNPPKDVDHLTYKKATAMEALVAKLYLSEPQRCLNIMAALLDHT